MPKKCPICNTELENWSEPDLDGHVVTFCLCPHCGFEVAGEDMPVTQAEWKR